MKRRRSVPHTFEDQIAAEKAKTEGQVAKLRPGPAKDALLKKIGQLEHCRPHKRMAYIAGTENTGGSMGKKYSPSDDKRKTSRRARRKRGRSLGSTSAISAKSSRSFGSHSIHKAEAFSWRALIILSCRRTNAWRPISFFIRHRMVPVIIAR